MKPKPIGKYTDMDFDRLLQHLDIPDNWDDYETKCWNCDLFTNSGGYCKMGLNARNIRAHRFMCVYNNHGYDPLDLETCHSCNNRICCSPFHLTFDTKSVNQIYKVKCGNQRNAKLMDNVPYIRDLYSTGIYTQRELCIKFDCVPATIHNIVKCKTFSWV